MFTMSFAIKSTATTAAGAAAAAAITMELIAGLGRKLSHSSVEVTYENVQTVVARFA